MKVIEYVSLKNIIIQDSNKIAMTADGNHKDLEISLQIIKN
ncbi:hypothetical protein HMPREF1984_01744 [Leptotrichia sp. oral taxon 215 str. W9775]|nr:hypothetical protein HMPREF1984_01744 [Leptotrichia sp. oral taxon 215 str. W9775]